MRWTKANISVLLLIIFYVVGIIGIGFQIKPDMVLLSWFNLLLTGVIIFINRTENQLSFYWFSMLVFFAGLSVEILGVATGFPFGNYHYGSALGWKLMEVPIILGLNWWILVYASIHLSMLVSRNKTLRFFLAPALMLGIDVLIEPLSSKLDFWYWEDIEIPLENYISWYVISFALIGIYFLNFNTKKISNIAIIGFGLQTLFFSILNILL